MFADCFPDRINFGDVDGWVELSGCFCVLEWKGQGGSIKTGQLRTFREFTAGRLNLVVVVEGDAETMEVSRWCFFWDRKDYPWRFGNLENVKACIRRWVAAVQGSRA